MGSFGLGGGVASSFVVAALVAAVFLSSKIGGDRELILRAVQVAIAFAMFILVISTTATIIRPPDTSDQVTSSFSSDSDEEEYLAEAGEKASAAGTVHLGAGFILIMIGVARYRRWKAIPIGLLLSGLLLLMLGSTPGVDTSNPLNAYYAFALSATTHPDLGWDIARLTVMLAGTVALLMFAHMEFDRPDPPPEPPLSQEESEPSPAV